MNTNVVYISNKKGLEIIMRPTKIYVDEYGNPHRNEGKRIQFVNGKFTTNDKETIEFLDKYMKTHSDLITKIDPKKVKKEKEILEKVKKEMEKEE